MGLGILEDRVMDHVPGTTRYFDDPERPQIAHDGVAGLKTDNSGPEPIILVPQPSDDPNDPLNWPLWQRDMICFILSLTAIFATSLGPILAANTLTLSLWFKHSFTKVATLTGYFLLGVGAAGTIFVPSSRIWGKRHAFLIGLVLLVASSAWGGAVHHNYKSFLGSRIIQGIGAAPYEALVNAAVGDLYFVHERGKRMAFTNLAVFGGSFFTPILVGKITHSIGWEWTFYLVAIFCGACFPAVFFFCPETAFVRNAALNTDLLSDDEGAAAPTASGAAATAGGPTSQSSERTVASRDEEKGAPSAEARARARDAAPSPPPPARVGWLRRLAPFNGRKSDENFFKLLFRPFALFLQPAFLWACVTQGLLIGWTVFIGVILAEFFMNYPLWWDEKRTGYAYTGPFVGALLGFCVAGLLADWSAKRLTRLNNGIYEPEFRLALVVPQLVFGVMGLFGFGITIDRMVKLEIHWAVPLMFFGFEVCGMVLGAVASSLYIVDAYRFTCMIIFKNFFSFALTFKAYDWLMANDLHARHIFVSIGAVQLVVCLLSIPMYVFGKRNRSFFHRHDLLAMFCLR